MAELWVVLQEQEGLPPEYNQEVLAEAKEVAAQYPGQLQLCAVQLRAPLSSPVEKSTVPFFKAVVPERLYVLEHPALGRYTTEGYVAALSWLIRERTPALIVTSATVNGQDWAPRLAAQLGLPFVARCLRFALEQEALLALRALYGGRAYVQTRTRLGRQPALVTFAPGTRGTPPMTGSPAVGLPMPEVITYQPSLAFEERNPSLQHLGIEAPSAEEVELEAAEKIVAGGRGVGREGFAELAAFARLLGAAVGASRVATDRGWVEPERQIGATGKSVSPRLYIACGISGAAQHTSGIREAQTVVAINPDRNAPIFALADLGLLGDAREILRHAMQLLQEESVGV
ncbi:electron transfer flavoprotein subunit alpha/FixB family protein [Thermogemmatispora carboxidivorans]|uniref:electron transfer flavoprotein subunit alpha/FixB family protein n=1 Tax=Thermogemmatispora carboxidivorans TaxID=1382306 RepID=UPI000A4525EC|nr:electron transfer flavoprotein subunit alpha/FixB family protein [Thermogemmatispora carboxidivorans]